MRGLTVLVATADPVRFRAALSTAAATAALGGRARVFLHEDAVVLLQASADSDAARFAVAGLPSRADLVAIARESGVELLVCQSGLALTGLSMAELPAGTTAGGLVSLLATLGEDRLLAF
ncbi:DsrE family protein [Sphingomonas desiccabilis]|uniref:Peroxiredoxin n=1 Tax=Sphingomonas desiccabilis TaxID=429134 RepID=A0A4Q2IZL4_9SPHN|nr:DsrE family protein [Sphingomonas desiccabilis]MBB3910014.1 putative peroxiredoxin [Sphingomonas desiccabilis]RXZ34714.1 peroxiredoxin [Sphingomonas desiccabilis]